MNVLIAPAELAADKAHIVFDCRYSLLDKPAGRRSWEAGHIPGARFADLERDLSSPAGKGGRHPLPDREALAARFRAWGVDNDSRLVCYDQSGVAAAKLAWVLSLLGHEDVAVYDGGWAEWGGRMDLPVNQ